MSKTHVGFILDMSGSMMGIERATVEGVVGYVEGLKKDLGKDSKDVLFSLTIFDTLFESWVKSEPLEIVKAKRVMAAYTPRGATALYDAIGKTVTEMRPSVKKEDKAIVVVMTDGHENSSVEWDRVKVNKLITKLTKRGNWTFVYMGANVDSYDEASKIGVMRNNSVYYAATGQSVGATMDSLSHATSHYARSASVQTHSLMADAGEKTDFREAKVKGKQKT